MQVCLVQANGGVAKIPLSIYALVSESFAVAVNEEKKQKIKIYSVM